MRKIVNARQRRDMMANPYVAASFASVTPSDVSARTAKERTRLILLQYCNTRVSLTDAGSDGGLPLSGDVTARPLPLLAIRELVILRACVLHDDVERASGRV